MSKKSGWWSLKLEGCNFDDLEDMDLEHIANLIKDGYTNGEIVED